jgi:Zn-dependent protease
MLPKWQSSFHLFRFAGIDVFLHWSWFLVAIYGISSRAKAYSSPIWCVLEYLSLFAIVLTHEFGHALACRQVGGQAARIILWPLGGVAFVAPPQRPGATLWSIAAGPLVNAVLAPILTVAVVLSASLGLANTMPNAARFLEAVCTINWILLVFNLLPIYPLDGGQILRSLLWFIFGRARSLMIAAIIGFVGVAGMICLAVLETSPWLGIVAVFILLNCWGGLTQARILARIARLPRRSGFECPECKQPPVLGPYWRCARCLKPFDTFQTLGVCPDCGTEFPVTQCLDCGSAHPFSEWVKTGDPSREAESSGSSLNTP